ncbi:MAG TPA: zf-HC2 domain-containing protein [Planctomycetota bacterium]|jgi:anti-sigma factor RsiW|nr:zf-HC2 domain-containing protein [Planctomycetota bacterium]
MNCEEARVAIMGLLDGELPEEPAAAVREHLRGCRACALEEARYRGLEALAKRQRLPEPTDAETVRFWSGFYNRSERRAGWIFLLLGLALLAGIGATRLTLAEAIPLPVRLGLLGTGLGLFLLFLSVLRLRLRTLPFDRYRRVLR